MSISNAIAQNRISAVVGYNLTSGNFNTTSDNLPQAIAVLGEANTANQGALVPNVPQQITSAAQAAALYGSGSPIHSVVRILLPVNGGGTNAPVFVYPQAAATSSTARTQTLTVTGTATAGGTHYVNVAGRNNVDGAFYQVNIVTGDTPTIIAGKIRDAINGVTSSPMSATASLGVATVVTKWTGLTAESMQLSIDSSLAPTICVTYVVAETIAAIGTPALTPALNLFMTQWNPNVINCYGTVATTLTELETFNGVPGATGSTGRYAGIVFKPFIAFTGSVADDPSTVTSTHGTQVTIAICPAPLSPGQQYEAAANMAVRATNAWINDPASDIVDQTYPDMPMPALSVVPAMQDYNNRDRLVQLGCSTVYISNGVYKIQDFVTTFYDGTMTPAYRWCRDLCIDFNIAYGFNIIEISHVKGKIICKDGDAVSNQNIIKPKMLKAIIYDYIDQLVSRAMIADAHFSKTSTQVTINATNNNRLDDAWNYKRTGIGRILSTTVAAGANFSN